MGRRKLEPVLRANPDWLISTDASCLLHLEGLLRRWKRDRPQTLHVAEVLAARGDL
jgi:Fe-S oxidoreductase